MPRGKRKKTPTKRTSLWTEFEQVFPHTDEGPVELERGETFWRNSFYLVMRKELDPEIGMDGPIRLSIKHNYGKAIREWKHLQRIKNELAGPDREAMEIFPPEEMLVSLDNEHHLFVTPIGVSSVFIYEEKVRAEGVSGYEALRGQS